MKRYDPEAVKKIIMEIAKAAGVPEDDVGIFSDSLVEADMHAMATHGVSRVNVYIRRIQKGLIDPRAEISIEKNGQFRNHGRCRKRFGAGPHPLLPVAT